MWYGVCGKEYLISDLSCQSSYGSSDLISEVGNTKVLCDKVSSPDLL